MELSTQQDHLSCDLTPDLIQPPSHFYRRTADGISIGGSGRANNQLKVIDLLGFWTHKLAPYLIAAIVIFTVGAKGLPVLLMAGGWSWLKRIMKL